MQFAGWLGRVAALCVAFFFSCAVAQAAPSPAIQKGLTWLQSQVQADGSLAGEAASLATPLQARSETLYTLSLLATPSASQAGILAGDTEDNTEYLARKAVALAQSGQSAASLAAALAARQNPDGGFGGAPGYASNALDTAWALLAFKMTNTAPPVANGLGYLQAVQGIDGAFRVGDVPDVYTSALVLQGLAAYASEMAVGQNIQAVVAYLQAQQSAPGVWANSAFLTAIAYQAVHDFLPLDPTASALTTFLVSSQVADGSWNGDPYVTALALRALVLADSAPANPTLSVIRGKVVDSQTGQPLSGVAITLSGAASGSLLTQADGMFEFRDLQPGQLPCCWPLPITLRSRSLQAPNPARCRTWVR